MDSGVQQITCSELNDWLENTSKENPQLLDVREGWEFAYSSLRRDDVIHIPMDSVANKLEQLNPKKPIVCICHHGVRSFQIAWFLKSQGFEEVFNMRGGMAAWSLEVDPDCPTY